MKFIRTKNIEPYYILLGTNELFKESFIKELEEDRLKGQIDPSSIYTFSFAEKNPEISVDTAIEKASTPSFFSQKNLLIIREFGRLNKSDTEKLFEFLSDIPDFVSAVLTYSINLREKRNRGYRKKLARDHGVPEKRMLDFSSGAEKIKEWFTEYMLGEGKKIDPEVLDFVIEEANFNASSVKNELDKMILLTKGRNEITKEDFSEIRGVDRGYDIWALTSAVGAGDRKKTFEVLDRIYEYTGPEMILGAVFREIQKIFLVRFYTSGGDEAKALKLTYNNPRALWAVKKNAKNYKNTQYIDIVNIIKEADKTIKLSDRKRAKTILIMMFEEIFLTAGAAAEKK